MMAILLDLSPRQLSRWKHESGQPARPLGRPKHDAGAVRRALRLVRRMMQRAGKHIGEPRVVAALQQAGTPVPRRLVRFALARWKARDRGRARAWRAEHRVHIHVEHPGTVLSIDGAQLGRIEGRAVRLEHVVDVHDSRTRAGLLGTRLRGEHVVAALESACTYAVPIAVFHDGGSENVNGEVGAWAKRHRVVLVRNRPHTPQHNPWSERKHRAVREVTGLRANTPVHSLAEVQVRVEHGLRVLDTGRTPSRPERRSAPHCPRPGPRYSPAWREATWAAAEAARALARRTCARPRVRLNAEREAVLQVLEERGVLFRVRGDGHVRRVKAEVIS